MSIPTLDNYSPKSVNRTYSNKPQWQIDPSRAVLLIHDMQQYFLDFYGKASDTVDELLETVSQLKTWCRGSGIPCVYTAQPGGQNPEDRALLSDFWGEGLANHPDLIRIVPQLSPEPEDRVFTKWRYSAFKKNDFQAWLVEQEKDQLLICGVYGHIGILTTALDAFMLDIKPFVIADAIADFTAQDHEMALDYIAKRCGVVTDTSELMSKTQTHLPPLTADLIKQDIAEVLMIDSNELKENDNLQDLGLDSIRVISLLEKWQSLQPDWVYSLQPNTDLNYADFIEEMTLSRWKVLLQRAHLARACEVA